MTFDRFVVLINSAAGSVDASDTDGESERIKAAFADVAPSLHVDVEAVDPAKMQDRIREIWASTTRPAAIIAGGGDGTVNNAANAAAGTDIVLGVLPLGTFNHFAGDVGLVDALRSAALGLATATITPIDVAEVNGRVFVNNSLIGVYPEMVAIRDEVMDRRGWGKAKAVPVAVARVLRRLPIHRVGLSGDNGFQRDNVRTPFLFVGNGVFESAGRELPVRDDLADGALGIEIARTVSRLGLVRIALQALVRGTHRADGLERATVTRLTVRSRARRLRVAVDGEIAWVTTPLTYQVRPGVLNVLVPRPVEASS